MIPLRILHVCSPHLEPGVRAGAPTLLPWLAQQGHAVAAVVIGEGGAPAPILGRREGWWSWWRRGRAAAVSAAGSWGADLIHAHGEASLATALDLARGIAAPVLADPGTIAGGSCLRQLRDGAVAAVLMPGEEHRATVCSDVRIARDRVVILPPGVDGCVPAPRHADGGLVVGARLRDRAAAASIATVIGMLVADGLAVEALVSCAPGVRLPGVPARIRQVEAGAELAGCDVLVELATSDLPMGHVVDALAAGRVVVAVAAGILPELIQDGRSGVLVPPGDVVALAGALRQLAANDHRAGFAAGALQAARRHDIALVGEAVINIYRAAIGGSSAAGATTWKRLTTERLRRRTSNRMRATGA